MAAYENEPERGDGSDQGGRSEQSRDLIPGSATLLPDNPPSSRLSDDRELARFLIGLMLLGKDQLEQLLAAIETEDGVPPGAGVAGQEEQTSEQFRYLALGLLARGQRRAGKTLRTAYNLSTGTARWTLGALDRLTDGWLMRPVRYPIERRIRRWQMQREEIIEEGKLEEADSREMAADRVEAIVGYVVDQVAESEEMDRLIVELVGKKGATYASALVDNLRSLALTADYLMEGVLRRLLRRTPRSELPGSLLVGQPQTMYEARGVLKGGADDV